MVGGAGLVVNLVGLFLFSGRGQQHGHSHGETAGQMNLAGVFLHLLADTLGSLVSLYSTQTKLALCLVHYMSLSCLFSVYKN